MVSNCLAREGQGLGLARALAGSFTEINLGNDEDHEEFKLV